MAFPWKNQPSPIQKNAIMKAWGKDSFAFLHAMGAGKTFTVINLAAGYHLKDALQWLVIICPNAIKDVWRKELETHSPVGS